MNGYACHVGWSLSDTMCLSPWFHIIVEPFLVEEILSVVALICYFTCQPCPRKDWLILQTISDDCKCDEACVRKNSKKELNSSK